MSRSDFRAMVSAPRPAAAWLMSIVATSTLWLTEQVPLWIGAVQCFAFAISFSTRSRPRSFQRSPILLNIFMLAITTITIRSALNGNSAAVSLAYFTALAQGLQLLDARPRKSEFVLVALALFQVVLASNLTDSVFFPPLLLVFLASVTWTLLVHTISMEAAEAGDPTAATAILGPELWRMTAKATCICVVLAVILFVVFPRVKTNLLRGGIGSGFALSGFSDRVALGHVGQIRMDHSVVLRVRGIGGALPIPAQAYWRGLAFDQFDGRNWSISASENGTKRRPISGVGRFGIELLPQTPTDEPGYAQQIIREPIEAGVIFVPGEVQRIEGSFQGLERDRNGGLYLAGPGAERLRYTIWSKRPIRDVAILREDRAWPPMESSPGGEKLANRYLALPDLDPRVRAFAEKVVAGAESDFDRARMIRDALRRDGRYTDSPPPLGDEMTSPIEAFILGELEGHCEYFASAMVTLARTQGLPSRLINGFAGGVPNELGGFVEVTQADAHAWVEIHFEKSGWVRFDPTPVDLRLRSSDQHGSLWARLGEIGGAVELWWFQRVVDFDSVDQISTLRGLWFSWSLNRSDGSSSQIDDTGDPHFTRPNLLSRINPIVTASTLLVSLLLFGCWYVTRTVDESPIPRAYRSALQILAKRGMIRSETDGARDFARRVAERIPTSGGVAFTAITTGYLAERFGQKESWPLDDQLESLENAVDRMRLGNESDVGEPVFGSR